MRNFASLIIGLILIFGGAFPTVAKADSIDTILKILAQAGVIDSAIVDAKPLVECLVQKSPAQCVDIKSLASQKAAQLKEEATSKAEQAAQQFVPNDPAIKAVVDIIKAANASDWIRVLELTGVKLLGQIACKAGLSWGGPLKPFICGEIADKVLTKAEPVVHEILVTVKSWPKVNIWKLIQLFGFELACEIAPNIPMKSQACSTLGKAVAEVAKLGKQFVSVAQNAAQEVNQVLTGGGGKKKMDAGQYYSRVIRPLMYKRVVQALMTKRSNLGLDPAEIKQCVAYGSLAFGALCPSKMSQQLHKEASALVTLVKSYPETYFRGWLQPAVQNRAVDVYSYDEAGAYKKFIDQLPAKDWDDLVHGQLPLQMFVNSQAGADFYKKQFVACKDHVGNLIYGQGTSRLTFPGMSPSSAVEWVCYRAVGKLFSAVMVNERQRLQTNVIPQMAKNQCAQHTKGTALSFDCQTYTGFAACLQESDKTYRTNKYCQLNRVASAKALGQDFVGVLGGKRCRYLENDPKKPGSFNPQVACTRPWKTQTCEALLDGFPVHHLLPADRVETRCVYYEEPTFIAGKKQAKKFVFALNGKPAESKSPSTQNNQCFQTWDPLAISCVGQMAVPSIPGYGRTKFDACPQDPNRNGADEMCYVPDRTVSQSDQKVAGKSMKAVPEEALGGKPLAAHRGGDPDKKIRSHRTVDKSDQTKGGTKMKTVLPGVLTGQPPSKEKPGEGCGFDLTYLIPQSPVLEISVPVLRTGNQFQIRCKYVPKTDRMEWTPCGKKGLKAMSLFTSMKPKSLRGTGVIAIDGQTVGVSTPKDNKGFEQTKLWTYKKPGTHEVACKIDNPKRFFKKLPPQNQFFKQSVTHNVSANDGKQIMPFDASKSRVLSTEPAPEANQKSGSGKLAIPKRPSVPEAILEVKPKKSNGGNGSTVRESDSPQEESRQNPLTGRKALPKIQR